MTTFAQAFAPDRRLGTVLKIDAAFCAALAVPALVAPGWLAGFLLPGTPFMLGTPMETVLLEVGVVFALSALALLFLGTRPIVSRTVVTLSAAIDAGLAAATLLALAVVGGAFSPWGAFALLMAAVDTAAIAWLKLRAVRSLPPSVEAAA